MRLIDADELERKVSRLCPELSTPDGTGANDGLVFAAQDILIDVMQEIHDTPTIAPPPNPPLTPEELRKMDGEPVWVTPPKGTGKIPKRWMLVECMDRLHSMFLLTPASGISQAYRKENYGKTWLAYRRKPEEGET